MTRVASLYLPQLAIERLRRAERLRRSEQPASLPETTSAEHSAALEPAVDDNPGACSVPRGGGWRPGARWSQGDAFRHGPAPKDIAALPAHQQPTTREMGRRSEPAEHPFKAMHTDDGTPRHGAVNRPAVEVRGTRPLVLIERAGQRECIVAACLDGLALGLRPGMAAAHARALVADLDVRDAEPENDRAFLDRLALHGVHHWTPMVSVSGADGLWLDLTGTTHLFGGEERFSRRLLHFMRRLGFTAAVAIAGTPGAAHALARYSRQAITLLPAGTETAAIADLPIAALRLGSDTLTSAARFGLERIGDLYPMPRGPLARRLGLSTVERLDQARGLAAEPIIPVVPFDMPRAERRLLEPIVTPEAILEVMRDLVSDLVSVLQARGLGVRSLILTCLRVDSDEQRIGLGTAKATRDPAHLQRMLSMRVERIEPGLGIEEMRLVAPRVEQLEPMALAVPFAGGKRPPDIASLADQLGGRLGEDALFRMSSVESDVPERAVRREHAMAAPAGWPSWKRPARLLRRPELLSGVVALLPDHPPRRFAWRGKAYQVVAGDGPERIHGEWWRSEREMWAVRDYFRVEADGGERFWVFRRGDGVDAPTGDLTWYMHGVFG